MKNYLIWFCTAAALFLAGAGCTDDPEVGRVAEIEILQSDLAAAAKGDELVFNVVCATRWHIEFTDPQSGEMVRWITSDMAGGSGDALVTLTVSRNLTAEERKAYVTVVTDMQNTTASVLLTQAAGSGGGVEGYAFPICEMFRIDAGHNLSGAFIDGNDCIFDNGLVITRTGNDANMRFSCPCHTNPKEEPWFQRGITTQYWETGDAYLLEIPLKDELSGALRYSFGSRKDNAGAWECAWSSDGENWSDFEGSVAAGSGNDAVWKSIGFTIPEERKIAAGGRLMIRMTPLDASKLSSPTLFQHGICITRAEAERSSLPAMDEQSVVFACGFDELIGANASYIDLPMGYMTSWVDGVYSPSESLDGMVAATACYNRPGFVQVGAGNEAILTTYKQGAFTIRLDTRLAAMNISKADLKLSFLASAMVDAYGVATDPGIVVRTDATSGATVDNDGRVKGVADNAFRPFTVYIRNATPETQITITSADMASGTDDVRFFLDDLLVEVEGEPERPDADDPVKSEIAAVRALKGSSAVTVTENIYMQGRVVAVDNVPEGYFALADDQAGIFVKLSGHQLAAGDLAEVIVRGAQLAVDADGLLTLTPVSAEMVTKKPVAAEMPEARPVTVADLRAGTSEGMYVVLPESQVADADLQKKMSGDVTLETDDGAAYTMRTLARASFSAESVPQKAGVVRGVAGASCLLPTAMADLAGMTGARFGEAVYAIEPVDGHLYVLKESPDADFTFRDITYADKTVTYARNGCTITKVGGGTAEDCYLKVSTANALDARYYTRGWGGDNWQDNGLVFKIRATSRIAGNLRFGFGLFGASAAALPRNWEVVWSTDNATWNSGVKILEFWAKNTVFSDDLLTDGFVLTGRANDGGYRMALFNVPESRAVAEGGYLYVKIRQRDNTPQTGEAVDPAAELIFINGFTLSTHEKRAYHTSALPSGSDVVLAEGFDDALWGPDRLLPCWQMFASHKFAYTMPAGWSSAGSVFECPGYVQVGGSASDAASSITTPALAALGDTPTDITVRFRAATLLTNSKCYTPDPTTVAVRVSGSGTVGAENYIPTLSGTASTCDAALAAQIESEYIRWYECSARITGATRDTKITLTGTGRHFFDQIVVTRD